MVVGLRLQDGALVVASQPDDAALLAGQEQVREKICRQFGPTAEPGLLVDGRGMLACGALSAAGRLGDVLVTVALEQQQRDLALGGSASVIRRIRMKSRQMQSFVGFSAQP